MCTTHRVGMSFWTDAAVLGDAGIPSVLFGPGGAGLHSIEEYVTSLSDVSRAATCWRRWPACWCGSAARTRPAECYCLELRV